MDKPEPVAKICYAQMVKQFLSRDPFECVLCGGRMVYRRAVAGLNVDGLKKNARDISLLRYIPGGCRVSAPLIRVKYKKQPVTV